MTINTGDNPLAAQNATVQIHGIDIICQAGQYTVIEANRFGQKISEGDLRYQDFNPYESAEATSNFLQGAGIRSMSDVEHTINLAQPYKETQGVDASGVPVILAPEQVVETLPSAAADVVWIGEFVPATGAFAGVRQLVAVAGTKVWRRNPTGSGAWIDTGFFLSHNAVKSAVGVVGGYLIFGYGAAGTAEYTSNLTTLANVTDTSPAPLYVYAITVDRAAVYIAGGPLVTNVNLVNSASVSAATPPTSFGVAGIVTCGSPDSAIRSLAPGGGLVTVFVGKENELGEIDNAGIYRTLVPFDSRQSTNCVFLQWWLGSGGDEQRGPLSLIFPRERGFWNYVPNNTTGGSAQNISPWANPVIRPPNAKGRISAARGSARWLYFVVVSSTGQSWVWKRDSWVGPTGNPASHTWLYLGAKVSECCAISNVTSATGNPMFYAGVSSFDGSSLVYNIVSVILPLDGESEIDDPHCRFTTSGYIDLSDVDFGFPDEDKVAYSERFIGENMLVGQQYLKAETSIDDGPVIDLGQISTDFDYSNFPVAAGSVGKRIKPRIWFFTTDPTKTPRLRAVVIRAGINPVLFRLVQFKGQISSGGFFFSGAEDLSNPKESLDTLWADRRSGQPVPFTDRWNDDYLARIISMSEQQTTVKPDDTPTTLVSLTLLLTAGPATSLIYDNPDSLYDTPQAVYG